MTIRNWQVGITSAFAALALVIFAVPAAAFSVPAPGTITKSADVGTPDATGIQLIHSRYRHRRCRYHGGRLHRHVYTRRYGWVRRRCYRRSYYYGPSIYIGPRYYRRYRRGRRFRRRGFRRGYNRGFRRGFRRGARRARRRGRRR